MTESDDLPVGRVLTRREALKLMAGVAVATLVGCRTTDEPAFVATATAEDASAGANAVGAATAVIEPIAAVPNCVVRPEMTEGPFFAGDHLDRSDIRTDSQSGTIAEGVPLLLTFIVSQIGHDSCSPLPGAVVDIWHCDAAGVYSEFESGAGADFLRGFQQTDAGGQVTFTTIYPGWYPGRAVHIHFKIRVPNGSDSYEFTSQLFFDDTFTDEIYKQEPYSGRPSRSTRNVDDNIFRGGGEQLLLVVARQNDQITAAFDIGLDLTGA